MSLLAVAAASPAAAASVHVPLDGAEVVRLDRPAATVVVGNPGVADVTVEDGDTVFVFGRMFGTTNVIFLDANGGVVADLLVTVAAREARAVTLHRGATRVSYACVTTCERTLVPGDGIDDWNALAEQGNDKAAQADGRAADNAGNQRNNAP